MVFSDKDIKDAIKAGIIGIDPYFEKDVQPASVDLHLDKKLLIFNNSNASCEKEGAINTSKNNVFIN